MHRRDWKRLGPILLILLLLSSPAVAAEQLRLPLFNQPPAPAIELGPLAAAAATEEGGESQSPEGRGGVAVPRQVGLGRELSELRTAAALGRLLSWQVVTGGQAATIKLGSYGAAALRLGVLVEQLPDAAELRFFGRAGTPVYLVTGETINRGVARNLAAPVEQEGDPRLYWSPLLTGELIGLEIYLPEPLGPEDLALALPWLSHIYEPIAREHPLRFAPGQAAACHYDISCSPDWAEESGAVALLYFNVGTSTYQCSATLLNDRAASRRPYLLTARHCIDRQSRADTVQTLWFYRSSACNSGISSPDYRHLAAGSQLLTSDALSDSTLLELREPPPAGVTYAGWSLQPPPLQADVAGLHHPQSDHQKLNLGVVAEFRDCTVSAGFLDCSADPQAEGGYLNVANTVGVIEEGSSGSGLFLAAGGYLVGSLSGGNASCENPAGTNIYSRFDRIFSRAELWRWLDPAELFRQGDAYRRLAALVTVAGEPPASDGPLNPPSPEPPPVADGGGGGGCFIATAAYGCEWAPQVTVLREFRDRVLLRSAIGRELVEFYYRHSPGPAAWLARRSMARAVVRAALLPAVGVARWATKNFP